jgi:hypothetical protein
VTQSEHDVLERLSVTVTKHLKQSKGEGFILAHSVRGEFRSIAPRMAPLFWDLGFEVRQNIMVVEVSGVGGCSSHGRQEAEGARQRGCRDRWTLQRHTASDLLLPLKSPFS